MERLPFYGFLGDMHWGISVLAALLVLLAALETRRNSLWFPLAAGVLCFGIGIPLTGWVIFAAAAILVLMPPVRRVLVSLPVMRLMDHLKVLPKISSTERAALDAGSTWIETELFSGKPDFSRIRTQPYTDLSSEEKAFLDGPIEALCNMTSGWEIRSGGDIPVAVWEFARREKVFAVTIPKEWGGLGFSAGFFTAMVSKIASRSGGLAVSTMVPNTVGPAELLLHYGTQEQKEYYLPRLARAEDIPCFALTEVEAGSDAGAVRSEGILFRGEDGELKIRLNFRKRYISLSAIATLIGLAVRLRDPEGLLGRGTEVGITAVLVPAHLPGIVRGQRHDALGAGFVVAPIEGHDVVIPAANIIGGLSQAGKGWKMLIEALAAGRGLSLPAYAAGQAKLVARVAGAYAAVRRQFGLPLGRFEGIEEPLGRIGGIAYLLEAVRRWNGAAVDAGQKSAVVSAISKHRATELARIALNDGMDIFGGRGICLGPRNLIAGHYLEQSIPITVEGANILTRSMMIFGQGAFRCHPYAYREVKALEQKDLRAFDAAFSAHAWHVLGNLSRTVLLSVTRGWWAARTWFLPAGAHYRRIARMSASFAFLADVAMMSYGGKLKSAEKVAGRFADVLSWMYMLSAALRRFEAEGMQPAHQPFVDWISEYACAGAEQAFRGLYSNLAVPGFGLVLKHLVAPWSRWNALSGSASDELSGLIARELQAPGPNRDNLTPAIFSPRAPEDPYTVLELAFELCAESEPLLKKLDAARAAGTLPRLPLDESIRVARSKGVLTEAEASLLERAFAAYWETIQVDAFPLTAARTVRVAAV